MQPWTKALAPKWPWHFHNNRNRSDKKPRNLPNGFRIELYTTKLPSTLPWGINGLCVFWSKKIANVPQQLIPRVMAGKLSDVNEWKQILSNTDFLTSETFVVVDMAQKFYGANAPRNPNNIGGTTSSNITQSIMWRERGYMKPYRDRGRPRAWEPLLGLRSQNRMASTRTRRRSTRW